MTNYIVHEGQSMIDIACELYGNAEMVVKLAQDNNLSITDDLAGRMILSYDETITALVDTATYLRLNNLNIVAADLEENISGARMLEYSEQEHTFEEHN